MPRDVRWMPIDYVLWKIHIGQIYKNTEGETSCFREKKKKKERKGRELIDVAQDRERWRAVLIRAMKIKWGKFLENLRQ